MRGLFGPRRTRGGTSVTIDITALSPEFRAEICGLVAARRPVLAIKLLRQQTGAGLAACRLALESIVDFADDPATGMSPTYPATPPPQPPNTF